MSRELSAYTGSTAVGRPTQQSDPGTSRLTGTDWSGRLHTWADLPTVVQGRYPEPALVEGVQQVALSVGGVKRLVRQAFRAYPDRVVFLTLTQQPEVLPSDALKAVGQWALKTVVLRAAGPVVKTSKAMDPGSEETASGTGGPDSGTRTPARQARAAVVFGYLPPLVRRSVERAVPTPLVWVGELAQFTDGGRSEQTFVMLRHDASTAVVIKATRAGRGNLARVPWHITQYVYTLASDRLQVGSATADRLRLGQG